MSIVPTVTLPLASYEQLKSEALEANSRLQEINRALECLYKINTSDLLARHSDYSHEANKAAMFAAMKSGEL